MGGVHTLTYTRMECNTHSHTHTHMGVHTHIYMDGVHTHIHTWVECTHTYIHGWSAHALTYTRAECNTLSHNTHIHTWVESDGGRHQMLSSLHTNVLLCIHMLTHTHAQIHNK